MFHHYWLLTWNFFNKLVETDKISQNCISDDIKNYKNFSLAL